MIMIDVFKTNVYKKTDARQLVLLLAEQFPSAQVNFDLMDEDKILRVHREAGDPAEVIAFLKSRGFFCEELE